MIKFVIYGILLTCINAASIDGDARIISQANNVNEGDGQYSYHFETSNGIVSHETGQGGVGATGGHRWQSPEGNQYDITYVANEDGYQPQGEHIREVADNVAKLLAYLKANPSDDDGSYKPSKYSQY